MSELKERITRLEQTADGIEEAISGITERIEKLEKITDNPAYRKGWLDGFNAATEQYNSFLIRISPKSKGEK